MSAGDMPDEYQPTSIRFRPFPRDQEVFAVGVGGLGGKSYDMTNGPFPTLAEALEVVPDQEFNCYVIHFRTDGTDGPVYRWSAKRQLWVRLKQDVDAPGRPERGSNRP